jgi:hypothetical protein
MKLIQPTMKDKLTRTQIQKKRRINLQSSRLQQIYLLLQRQSFKINIDYLFKNLLKSTFQTQESPKKYLSSMIRIVIKGSYMIILLIQKLLLYLYEVNTEKHLVFLYQTNMKQLMIGKILVPNFAGIGSMRTN